MTRTAVSGKLHPSRILQTVLLHDTCFLVLELSALRIVHTRIGVSLPTH